MANVEGNKKLSYKRFIPMLILMGIGLFLIVTGRATLDVFKYGINVFDFNFRTEIIYFIGFVVGGFHYLFITKDKQESRNVIINTSIGFIDSIGSALGYSFIIDKGMNVASGLLKEIFGIKQFFFNSDEVDYYSLGFVVLAVIVIGTVRLYQMAHEAVFEITHPFKDANTSNQTNGKKNNKRSKK